MKTTKYTFGNDKFSLEDAYHDCKLVFDGITDDDSFQEADTGLILYYANEIIYALRKALEGKDANALGNDCVSRRAVIDALRYAQHRFTVADEAGGMGTVKWSENVIYSAAAERVLAELPSAQPERKKGKWIQNDNGTYSCSLCHSWVPEEQYYYARFCLYCGARMEVEKCSVNSARR